MLRYDRKVRSAPSGISAQFERNLHTEDGVIANMVLEALIDHLNSIGSEYGDIFRLIYDGGKTEAVQKAFGLKKSTAIHRMKKARELAAEFISEE